MLLALLLILACLGLAYAELFHRARRLVQQYYPEFELENERELRQQHFDDPRLLMGQFNSSVSAIHGFVFSRASRHAIPAQQQWVFLALNWIIASMVLDLLLLYLWAFTH
ncbi:hypothetical protein [Chitinibacter tainanensis]|uniref:hypothetical protein n=1 Tax=Chitinibacter tainanensis TaxID=230667 RepID=UPI00040E2980|nr:hypothetical protein [Chitinibacter tainanensis]